MRNLRGDGFACRRNGGGCAGSDDMYDLRLHGCDGTQAAASGESLSADEGETQVTTMEWYLFRGNLLFHFSTCRKTTTNQGG